MRRASALTVTLAVAATSVLWPAGETAHAAEPVQAVVRWEASSTPAQRDAVLAELGAVRVRALSTAHDVDVVVAAAGSEHDVELHDHVLDARAKVAERERELEQASTHAGAALTAVASAEEDVVAAREALVSAGPEELKDAEELLEATEKRLEEARKDLEEAHEDEAKAQEHLDEAIVKVAEERTKHGAQIVKELDGEDHVLWAEQRITDGLGDDRFQAWPHGLAADWFHAWPHELAADWFHAWPHELAADWFHAWPSGMPLAGGSPEAAGELDAAHALATGAGVVVAVLDTGAPTRQDAAGAGYDFVDDDTDPVDVADGHDTDQDGLVDEAFGHGGIVAATVRAVAPDAQVLHYRVLDADGVGDPHAVALAVEDAVARGADVINLSAGSDTRYASKVLAEAFKDAKDAGVVVVAAAGNAGSEDKRYPAADKDVVAVAALQDGGVLASFSNRGKWAELAAPGVDIAGVLPDGRRVVWSGSSFAAPRVSGQFALLYELRPDLDAKDLRHLVRRTARELDDGDSRAVDLMGSLLDD